MKNSASQALVCKPLIKRNLLLDLASIKVETVLYRLVLKAMENRFTSGTEGCRHDAQSRAPPTQEVVTMRNLILAAFAVATLITAMVPVAFAGPSGPYDNTRNTPPLTGGLSGGGG